MRLTGIDSMAAANHFLETRFLPQWEERFSVAPRNPRNAHRRLDGGQRLEEILSVRVGRTVADDHTVSWDGNHWGVHAKKSARVFGERRWKSSDDWMARIGYASAAAISACAIAQHPYNLPRLKNKIKPKYHVPAQHPWRKPWNRTFLYCEKPDISTLR